jgi:hypothetical protein
MRLMNVDDEFCPVCHRVLDTALGEFGQPDNAGSEDCYTQISVRISPAPGCRGPDGNGICAQPLETRTFQGKISTSERLTSAFVYQATGDGRESIGALGRDPFEGTEYGTVGARPHGIPTLETSLIVVHVPGKGIDRLQRLSPTLHELSPTVQVGTISPQVLRDLADASLTRRRPAGLVLHPQR